MRHGNVGVVKFRELLLLQLSLLFGRTSLIAHIQNIPQEQNDTRDPRRIGVRDCDKFLYFVLEIVIFCPWSPIFAEILKLSEPSLIRLFDFVVLKELPDPRI